MDKRIKLKKMLQDKETYFVPGVFDCIGAQVVEAAGFQSMLVSGNAVSGSLLGLPDMGLLTMSEVIQASARIAGSVNIPVIADADTGYGQPLNFMRAVREFERGGVAGIHIEDQISPKKCAYYGGAHEIVPEGEFLRKLRAGLDARENPNFCIIARTDAMVSYGKEEAISRANRYLEAGADAVFVVGCSSIDEVEDVTKRIQGPVVININDTSPLNQYSAEIFRSIGVKLVLYPATLRALFLRQAAETMKCLYENGNTIPHLDRLATLSECQQMVKLPEYEKIEFQYSK